MAKHENPIRITKTPRYLLKGNKLALLSIILHILTLYIILTTKH